MGASNDKKEVNQAADSQIAQHHLDAVNALAHFYATNPSPLASAGGNMPQMPKQFGGVQGGGKFGGEQIPDALRAALAGGMPGAPPQPGAPPLGGPNANGQRPTGPPQMPGQAPGAQPPPGPPMPPPGLYGLLMATQGKPPVNGL